MPRSAFSAASSAARIAAVVAKIGASAARHRGRVRRARLILEEQTTTTAPAVFRHVAKIDVRHVLHPGLVRGDERREKRRRRRRRAPSSSDCG